MTEESLPQKPELERALIGALLVDPSRFQGVAAFLAADDFFTERYAWAYEAIGELSQQGKAVDFLTVGDEMEKVGRFGEELDKGAFLAHLSSLAMETPTASNAETYAAKIHEAAARRKLIYDVTRICQEAHDEGQDWQAVVTKAKARIDKARWDRPDKPVLGVVSGADILTTKYPDPVWAIPSILPMGLTILAGKSKLGKSWLALQIAQAIASGGVILDERVEQGGVLYLALEDIKEEVQERMIKQGWTVDNAVMLDVLCMDDFVRDVGDLRNGGGERLAAQIEHIGYRLVVIDTLSKSVSGDQNDVEKMTRALTPLQVIAKSKNCAVMLIDHHSKGFGASPDAVVDILGSTAKGAVSDTIWGLYRDRGKSNAQLQVTGRRVRERTLALKWDYLTGCWQAEGDADEIALTERRQEILDVLEVLGRAGLVDVARETGQPKSHTHNRLQDLVNAGLVIRDKVGRNVFYETRERNKQDES